MISRIQAGTGGGVGGIGGVDALDGVGADLEAHLARLLSGGAMDVAGLGVSRTTEVRGQHISVATAMLNHSRDSTQRVIDSIGAP